MEITLMNTDAETLTATLNAQIMATATSPRPVLTHCAICAHSLTDSASIEVGIGPVCRERVEYDKIPEAKRKEANRLIASACANLQDRAALLVLADQLRGMGLDKLGAALLERFATVTIAKLDDGIAVKTPYDPSFASGMRSIGARWGYVGAGRIARGWVLPLTWAAALDLQKIIGGSFAGCVGKVVGGESFWI